VRRDATDGDHRHATPLRERLESLEPDRATDARTAAAAARREQRPDPGVVRTRQVREIVVRAHGHADDERLRHHAPQRGRTDPVAPHVHAVGARGERHVGPIDDEQRHPGHGIAQRTCRLREHTCRFVRQPQLDHRRAAAHRGCRAAGQAIDPVAQGVGDGHEPQRAGVDHYEARFRRAGGLAVVFFFDDAAGFVATATFVALGVTFAPATGAAATAAGSTVAGTIVWMVSRRAAATESHSCRALFTATLCSAKLVVNSWWPSGNATKNLYGTLAG
jgi:hypothetical protein